MDNFQCCLWHLYTNTYAIICEIALLFKNNQSITAMPDCKSSDQGISVMFTDDHFRAVDSSWCTAILPT